MKEAQSGIIDAISKTSKKFEVSDVPSLKSMYNCNGELVKPLLLNLVENKKMKDAVMKEITKEGK